MKKIAGPFDQDVLVDQPGISGEVTYNTRDSKRVPVPDALKPAKTQTQAPRLAADTIRGKTTRYTDPGRAADQPPMASVKPPAPATSPPRNVASTMGPRGRGQAPSSPTPTVTGAPAPKPAGTLGSLVNSFRKKAAMYDPFLSAFTDEVIKTAAIAPMAKMKTGATMLGQKVKAMASKVSKRAKGLRAQTKGGSGMKQLVAAKKSMAKKAEDETAGGEENAQDFLQSIMEAAQERFNNDDNSQGYNEQQDGGADDLSYGTGVGMKPKKRTAGDGTRLR